MISVTKLARMAAPDQPRTVTWRQYELVVGLVRDKAIGFAVGTEEWLNPRTGWPEVRRKLVFLPRSQIRLLRGEYIADTEVLVEVPDWLAKKNDL